MAESTHIATQRKSLHRIAESLTNVAKASLGRYYQDADNKLPYSSTIGPDGEWKSRGVSLSYAAISQIGIARWIDHRADALSAGWQSQANMCNAVELARVLQASTLAMRQDHLQPCVQPSTREAKNRLLTLFPAATEPFPKT